MFFVFVGFIPGIFCWFVFDLPLLKTMVLGLFVLNMVLLKTFILSYVEDYWYNNKK
jgi:hypothetical protein